MPQVAIATKKLDFKQMFSKSFLKEEPFIVERKGRTLGVLLGINEYEDLLDMIDVLFEEKDPKFQASLKKARKEYEKGEVSTIKDLYKILKEKEKKEKIYA